MAEVVVKKASSGQQTYIAQSRTLCTQHTDFNLYCSLFVIIIISFDTPISVYFNYKTKKKKKESS